MDTTTSTTTVTGPQPDFTVAAECGRGLSLQLERCKNLPSVHDGALWATTSEKVDRLTEKMDALIKTVANNHDTMQKDMTILKKDVTILKKDVAGLKTDVAGLKTDVAGLKTDVAGLKTDVAGLNVKVTSLDRNSVARAENALATETTTFAPLMGINTGQEIRGPTCLNDVRGMNAAAMSSCLQELGIIPKPTNTEKRSQLLRAYGVQFLRET
ncbi:hypothetical protein E4U09_003403 [Claviceps aff. purpurea]|uniref:Uncharacterized protein n=1 Tax=Claviceps aff. purpurea TaxID=1967640 RepID=A0A9P7QEN1_9HYPO|nr:hypothetical protein E4U09_003403 [Claviceps aff. purpurea]